MIDNDGRDVTVHHTGIRKNIGIHSWAAMNGTPEQEKPSRSIFLDIENAKLLLEALGAEIRRVER